MLRRLSILVVFAVLTTGCALKSNARKYVTVSMVGLHAAIAAVDDTERVVFESKATCDGPTLCITPAEHQAFSAKLIPVLETAKAATVTARQWPVGQPMPSEIRTLIDQVGALALSATELLRDNTAKSKIVGKVIFVQQAAIAILTALPLQVSVAYEEVPFLSTAYEARIAVRQGESHAVRPRLSARLD